MARENHKKASDPELAVHRGTLRRLAGPELTDVNGGAASWACDNQSVGFLGGEVCGRARRITTGACGPREVCAEQASGGSKSCLAE